MKVGIQLYSVRQSMAKDPISTISKVAEAGYRNLEVANHNAENDPGVGFGVSVADMKKLMEEGRFNVFSAHAHPLLAEKVDPLLEYHSAIGTRYIAVPIDFFRDTDEIKKKAEEYNKVGEKCKKAGIQLVYHNHYHEFQQINGETVLDTILKNTDENLLKLELDTYWVMRAGKDPIEVLKKLGKRVCLLHQKDFAKGHEAEMDMLASVQPNEYIDMDRFRRDIKPEQFAEIGTGIMPIQNIIDTAKAHCDVEYIVLEQDYTVLDEIESVKASMAEFKKFSGLTW